MNGRQIVLLFSLAMAVSAFAQAGQEKLPKESKSADATPNVDQILDKYVQALGGRAAIVTQTSRLSKGTFEIKSSGASGTAEIYEKAPNKWLTVITISGRGVMGVLKEGFNGTIAWLQDPQEGVREKTGQQLADMKLDADFYRPIKLRELYPKITFKGKQKVGNKETYQLEATPADGPAEQWYFDAQSGLLVRIATERDTTQGKMPIQIFMENYRDVDGVKTPTSIRQVFPKFTLAIKIEEVKHNVQISDAKFNKPEERPSVETSGVEYKLQHHHAFGHELHPVTLYITEETLSFAPGAALCTIKPFRIPLSDVLSANVVEYTSKLLNFDSTGTFLDLKIRNVKNPRKPFDMKFASADSSLQNNVLIEANNSRQDLQSVAVALNHNTGLLARREREREEEADRAEQARREAERRALPADLKASVQFDDSQSPLKTNRLDAGKKAELVITITNQGQGPAYDVALQVSSDNPQVTLPGPQPLGEIAPGQSQQLRLPIQASLNIPSGELNVLVEARERRGYDAQKVKLVIPMARLEKPSLSIENVLINDGTTGLARGNGNKIPESGETVELIVFVKNSGLGPAAAELSLTSTDPGIELVNKSATLGLIQPNQTVQGILVLGIPRTYASRNASLNIRVADTRGEGVATATRQMPLSVSPRAPGLTINSRIISRGAELQELANDQTVELELTPENSGTLDAVDVVVQVSASGVVLQKSQATVGVLRAGEKGVPERFELTIPRAFMKDRLPIAIELSQKDFPALTTTFEVLVKTRRPLLTYKFYVLGRVGGSTIEQNETADLEVQIINNGGLMAKDVQAAISAATAGVEIQGDKIAQVGVIAPQSQAVVRFRLHLLRSAPPGDLPVQLNIRQSDFPSTSDTIGLKIREELAEVKRVEAPTAPVGRPIRRKPVIALAKPSEGDFVREKIVDLIGTIADDKGISRLDVTVNGKPLPEDVISRGLRRRPTDSLGREQQDFNISLPLEPGPNEIRIAALNTENESEVLNVRVTRLEDRGTSSVPALLPQSDVDRYVLGVGAVRPDARRWAVVIGIEQYRKTASVPFATRDAYAMREYAIRVLGVPTEQVFLLTDDQATKAEMMLLLEERLQEKVRVGDTVYVYFAGHGIPEVKDGTPYLLPADGDPQSPRITGYSLEDFYGALGKLKAEKVAIFLDACFSGLKARDDNRETLLPGTRPGVIRVKNPVMRYPNLISFAAAGNDELSNAYRKEAHGLFTYFLLKGLSGGARMEAKGLLLSELSKYVISQVSRTSREIFGVNQHQTPIVAPDFDPARDIVLKEK